MKGKSLASLMIAGLQRGQSKACKHARDQLMMPGDQLSATNTQGCCKPSRCPCLSCSQPYAAAAFSDATEPAMP